MNSTRLGRTAESDLPQSPAVSPSLGRIGAALNYYEHHLGDYLRDTAHLSMIEDGAYRRLLDLYYTREACLPPNLDAICRLIRARTDDERGAVISVLDEFFTRTDDGYRHKRCDEEIQWAQEKRNKAAQSAGARWKNKRTDSERIADALPTQSEGNALQSPITNHQEEELMSASADVVRVFDHWRNVHGKARAKLDDKRKKLIRAALRIHPPDDLCRAIDGYKRSPFHQGQNDRNQVYDDIELMLRNAKQIEQGMGYAESTGEVVRWR